MKDIPKMILSVIAFFTAIILSSMSAPPYEGNIVLFSIILIALGGLTISLTIAVWSKQNRKITFMNSFKLSFGLSSLIFISGYLYTALQPIILK